ncbi:dynactin p62 family-domain-containing protein [Mycena olivaceomarginata]|nr:dynactin p62 family-domain-containing protein [Mycena olivaceomarginata]
MPPTVDYHCPCLSQSTVPPPPHLPSSLHSFHPLHTLFFCEECDAVRCNRCVSVEVSGYYCPNCLFEVPSASCTREKNRSSDPGDGRIAIPISTVGEPPFFLYCNHLGITFEKPTGLAAQLQKFEDSAPDSLEFERLKEHFEPVIRASSLSSSTTANAPAAHPQRSALTSSSHQFYHSRCVRRPCARHPRGEQWRGGGGAVGRDKTTNKDEMPEYRSRVDIASASGRGTGGGEADVEYMRHLENVSEVANLEQRWIKLGTYYSSFKYRDLKPLRIPLHSKRSKRCPACAHILIKPEQKAQSVRYKIKLDAANADTAAKRTLGKSTSAAVADDERGAGGIHAGKTYPFHLALTNPLYDPIQVRLTVQRVHSSASTAAAASEKARRPPFAVSLPSSSFAIAAYAEAWEYDLDDEDDLDEMFGLDERLWGRAGGQGEGRGVLEKKANMTVVGGEVVIGKDAGERQVQYARVVHVSLRRPRRRSPMTLRRGHAGQGGGGGAGKPPETKTFAFYTVVDLGPIIPREEPRHVDPDF